MHTLCLQHSLLCLPSPTLNTIPATPEEQATVLANMAYDGYAPNVEALQQLTALSSQELTIWWNAQKDAFDEVTLGNLNIGDYVVYKNFPSEVLNFSDTQYWFNQIHIYLQIPVPYASVAISRPPLTDNLTLKVLQPATPEKLQNILASLLAKTTRWTDTEFKQTASLWQHIHSTAISAPSALSNTLSTTLSPFKENAIKLIAALLQANPSYTVDIPTATDILRIACALTNQPFPNVKPPKFHHVPRPLRKLLLNLLNSSPSLIDDTAARPSTWKKLFQALHPGDYPVPNVHTAYNTLYNHTHTSFAHTTEHLLTQKDPKVLAHLQSRPGELLRRFHHLYRLFNTEAISALQHVLPCLTTFQLLKLERYVVTINDRTTLLYPPKGNWARVQIAPNTKTPLEPNDKKALLSSIHNVLAPHLHTSLPLTPLLDPNTAHITLPSNANSTIPYGPGTTFHLPPTTAFIRSASYWEHEDTSWFDNSFNFFSEDWKLTHSCCWNAPHGATTGALFSGDPLNTANNEHKGSQLIDLNLEGLKKLNVRYALWSILSFNNIPFSAAKSVAATLQFGENPHTGNLYEPSRAHLSIPITEDTKSQYIALIDLHTRQITYLGMTLPSDLSSATKNEKLSEILPSLLEYLQTLPTVHQLFSHHPLTQHLPTLRASPTEPPPNTLPVLFSDQTHSLSNQQPAYVFQPENPDNTYIPFHLNTLLGENTTQNLSTPPTPL